MNYNYKNPFGFLIVLFLLLGFAVNCPASSGIGPDAASVVWEAGTVRKLTGNQILAVTDYGISLEDGDEVITDENGRAIVLLSMLSEFDEIIIGPVSRVRISIKVSDSYTTIYLIHLLYGKIRVDTILNRSKQVRFDTSLAEVTADEGEFILESSKKGTTIGVIEGTAKLVSKASNREYQIPKKSNMFVSKFDTVSPAKMFDQQLFKGVEKYEWEKVVDPEKMQQERKRLEKIQKDKKALHDYLEAEKKRKERERLIQEQKRAEEEKRKQIEEINQQLPIPVEEEAPAVKEINQGSMLEEPQEDESFFSKYVWHISASSAFLVFNYMALQEATTYNDLANENDDLQSRYSNSTSSSERSSLMTDYEVNKEKMSQHKNNMQLYNYIALGALAWEGYLLYDLFLGDDPEEEVEEVGLSIGENKSLHFTCLPQTNQVNLSFDWRW